MGKFERNDRKGGKGGNGSKGSRGSKGGGGGGGGSHNHKGKPSFKKGPSSASSNKSPQQQQRHKKVEITFDPTSRREYLTGFSARKKERRAFGLAMQKVKDREAKLEERKEQREAQLERIEDIERNKATLRDGLRSSLPSGDTGEEEEEEDDDGDDDGGDGVDNDNDGSPRRHRRQHGGDETRTFRDERTTRMFGGSVSVTTTFGIPSDDDDDDDVGRGRRSDEFYAREEHGPGHVDEAQRLAGDVANYMTAVKGTMGSKKRGASSSGGGGGGGRHGGRKGQHGASTMKGMGNASTLKMAKRTLAKFKSSKKSGGGGDDDRIRGGGKGKKGRGRR
ncbi:hypothetical protein ACHAW5_008992 [Stephanodiscus triporus]|uniref:Nucleolar protein 12 n=1 Tax=Stephanodiscus triporus TaxID=2934178 RepID=A0ABD3PIL4_9STRA